MIVKYRLCGQEKCQSWHVAQGQFLLTSLQLSSLNSLCIWRSSRRNTSSWLASPRSSRRCVGAALQRHRRADSFLAVHADPLPAGSHRPHWRRPGPLSQPSQVPCSQPEGHEPPSRVTPKALEGTARDPAPSGSAHPFLPARQPRTASNGEARRRARRRGRRAVSGGRPGAYRRPRGAAPRQHPPHDLRPRVRPPPVLITLKIIPQVVLRGRLCVAGTSSG